jgi:hypothetical protein
MSIDLTLRWITGGALVAIALWEIVQLARRRDDIPLRVLAPGLVLLAIAATVGIKTPAVAAAQALFHGYWPDVINACWMAMAYCFSVYFLLAAHPDRRRKALAELGILVACVAVMTVVHETAPAGTWDFPGHLWAYRSWPHAVFYLAVDGYALTVWFMGVRRAAALRRRLTNPLARTAFWLVIAGSAGMALGVDLVSLIQQAIRPFAPTADLEPLHTAYSTGQLGGQLLLALGLALAPLAGALAGIRRRHDRVRQARYSRRLLPLWRQLTDAFPHIALPHAGNDFERLTVEITDGLAELARYCRPTGDTRDPAVAAAAIADALTRRDVEPEPPYPRIEPDFPDWRARARWMVAVGDRLRKDQEHGRTRLRAGHVPDRAGQHSPGGTAEHA